MDDTAASALFAWLDREVWLVTAQAEGQRSGLIATYVSQVSIIPDLPRVLIAIAERHCTGKLIRKSNAFALHLLGESQISWIPRFGLQSGESVDKFHSLTYANGVTGSPLLEDAVGWMDCRVEAEMGIGGRTVLLGEVVQSQVTCYGPPLTLKQVQEHAPAEVQAEMRRQLAQEITLESEAIQKWRASHALYKRSSNGQ